MKKLVIASMLAAAFGAAQAAQHADVVVIGAGGAGMAAAVTAHDLGAKVIVLEKMPFVGGNTVRATGGINAAETPQQAKLGIKDSIEQMYKDTMKGGHNKKSVRVEFVMSEQEAELVKGRMAELGITNLSAYLRKMAVDGYIIHLDMSGIQEMTRLLRICSNNLNQYTRRANETGSVYATDIEDLHTRLDDLWSGMETLLRNFANIP